MKIIFIFICFQLFLLKSFGRKEISTRNSAEIELIQDRLKKEYLKEKIQNGTYSANILSNGSWKDINYLDTKISNWNPIEHLNRLRSMACSYYIPTSPNYLNKQVLNDVKLGLLYWFDRKPVSKNWWWNTIGVQRVMASILIVLSQDLPKTLLDTGVKSLNGVEGVDPKFTTGANLIWFAQQTVIKSIMLNDEFLLRKAINVIEGNIIIGQQEGIQNDYSFHQHGKMLYMAGYGLQYLDDCTFLAAILNETSFSLKPDKVGVLSRYLRDGLKFVFRGPVFDYNVNGRDFTRKDNENKTGSLVSICNRMIFLDPENKDDYIQIMNAINIKKRSPIIGSKFFWSSDFLVHQTKDFYFSVKMVSGRTVGTETGNGENLKGGWLPYGSTYFLKSGSEYKDIFPVWDWTRIPGTTSNSKIPSIGYRSTEKQQTFVTGVTDGSASIAAMILNKEDIHGNKSWFVFDDAIVALGADISSDSRFQVQTSVEQSLVQGTILAKNSHSNKIETVNDIKYRSNLSWVSHNNTGYVFPKNNPNIYLHVNKQVGNWQSINSQYDKTTITKNVLSIAVNHGINFKGATYEYILVPKVDNFQILDDYYNNKRIIILQNDKNIQAVFNKTANIIEASFYKAGTLSVNKKIIVKADSPCLLIVKRQGDTVQLSVSNPSYDSRNIIVTIIDRHRSYPVNFKFTDPDKTGAVLKSVINISQ